MEGEKETCKECEKKRKTTSVTISRDTLDDLKQIRRVLAVQYKGDFSLDDAIQALIYYYQHVAIEEIKKLLEDRGVYPNLPQEDVKP